MILTRRDDRYLTLQSRVDQAIVHQADAFISVHHNSHENHMINGVITFFYTNGNDRALAHYIQQEVVKQTGRQDLKARRGNYYVLRQNPQLAILCELGFLSNYGEEMVIRSNDFQEKAAEGIFRGIIKYFQQQAENS